MDDNRNHNYGDTDEQTFLQAYDPDVFDRPSVTVDVALLTIFDGEIRTLLVKRKTHPEKGKWGLPGTFIAPEENLEEAAYRVLRNKVHERAFEREIYLEQLYTFGEPERDPRTRIITVAYYALVDHERFIEATRDTEAAATVQVNIPWEGETGGPVWIQDRDGNHMETAFDHDEIIGMAIKRIRGKLNYTPIGFQLLPEQFSLRQLQVIHETILGRPLNKDSFRRRMLATDMLETTGRHERQTAHRPAELYRFVRRAAV